MTILRPENTRTLLFQQLFEAAVISNPSKTAVTCKDQSITYARLNAQADRISGYLRQLGVGPGVPVGICIRRSIDMAAGILGILKSGGAYVPIDPALPGQRLAFMCKDAVIPIIITQSALVPYLTGLDARLICLDNSFPIFSALSNFIPGHSCIDPAYIIYTSGSTGRPKGVMIPHNSLCHFVSAAKHALGITADDVYLHNSSISYAVSVRQLMVPLCCGAAVVVAGEDQILEPLNLFKLIKQEGVTVMDVVPSYWRICVNILAQQKTETRRTLLNNKLRLIISVGESLSADLPWKWKTTLEHGADVINILGQTETTGLVSYYKITGEDLERAGMMPIGIPLENTRLLILDSQRQPVQSGELYVDNPSLAMGYLNLPELTAERFIDRSYKSYKTYISKKIYKTGDRVRRLADGNLEYIGRCDRQVKINGIRIELGEIEAVLNRYPHIREAAVVVQARDACKDQISAYVVPADENGFSGKQLRKYLEQQLPQWMIPSSFCLMESIPKTFSGKIDRLSLQSTISNRSCPAVRPGDTIEKKLCQLWQEHLCISELGVRDNFFQLGGDSLRAISLLDSLNNVFKRNLPVNVLFQAPTIEQLAAVIRGKDNAVRPGSIVPLNDKKDKFPVFCIHGVGGNVIFYRDLVNRIDLDVSFWGIHVPEAEDGFRRFSSLEEMAAFHISELRKFKPGGPYLLVGYSSGGLVAFEMACQLREQGFDVPLLVLLETHLPDNLHCRSKRLNPAFFIHFLKNMPLWLADFILGPEKKQRIKRKMLRMTGKPSYLWFDIKSDKKRELLKEQVKLVRGYHPKTYPGGITLFRSKVQTLLEPKPPDYGWGKYVAGDMEIRAVPGNHRSVLKAPHVKTTAAALARCIEKNLNLNM